MHGASSTARSELDGSVWARGRSPAVRHAPVARSTAGARGATLSLDASWAPALVPAGGVRETVPAARSSCARAPGPALGGRVRGAARCALACRSLLPSGTPASPYVAIAALTITAPAPERPRYVPPDPRAAPASASHRGIELARCSPHLPGHGLDAERAARPAGAAVRWRGRGRRLVEPVRRAAASDGRRAGTRVAQNRRASCCSVAARSRLRVGTGTTGRRRAGVTQVSPGVARLTGLHAAPTAPKPERTPPDPIGHLRRSEACSAAGWTAAPGATRPRCRAI